MGEPKEPGWLRWLPDEVQEEVRKEARETGRYDVSRVLLRTKLTGERERRQADAIARGMAFADLDRVRPSPDALQTLPPDLARQPRVLPLKRDGKTLWLAVADLDHADFSRVREMSGLRVIPVLCDPAALDERLEALPST